MTLTQLLNREVTIIRRSASGETDDYGNDLPFEDLVETVAEIQQRQRTEPGNEGELSVTDWLGIFPAGTVLSTGDAVEVDGLGDFELVGDPWAARNPRTQLVSHVEASLRRTAGAAAPGS